MCLCVGGGCRTDITALYITDDDQTLLSAVFDGPVIGRQPRQSELLIHGDLRLHGGNNIVHCIYNGLVELPDSLCSRPKCQFIVRTACIRDRFPCRVLQMLGHEGKVGIEPYDNRRIFDLDLIHQFLNHTQAPFSIEFYTGAGLLPSEQQLVCSPYIFTQMALW